MADDLFLPGLPSDLIRAVYEAAPGNEIGSGKFASPESSAALVANTFGLFLNQPEALPPLPSLPETAWPPRRLSLEGRVRFPWSGGRHPCLDVLIETDGTLIGIESKRYEPFRPKAAVQLSGAYWRPVWGSRMGGYERVRDSLRADRYRFAHLDAAQLVKHAFGLRTAVHRDPALAECQPILFYLYAEPAAWPDGRLIAPDDAERHRSELSIFASAVEGCEVAFHSCSYRSLLAEWSEEPGKNIRRHALAVAAQFRP